MEILLLVIIVILLIQSNNNALALIGSVIILGVAVYAIIWVAALVFAVALIGN